ncbi:MAG: hypothetical protein A2Y98_01870 [Candidatus Portnoybacteria bacterium RBG_19FT_COMBO_36_7]|uniref:Uncharacterized protein n=1 Tax=Candidatus Portnoybacteria bacterium RBG_19FT_COMBO_36_7 TaxID=1801992 RepID=A0A1G2F7Q7_9BACT|nr:MAG: hypothetical protein A2Y98_01870 [Candidatus Portnoybacteria bacterium RBG_19FT_COMBO_36_7]
MKKNFKIFIKLVLLAFFSLLWFVFIQAEYEIITKPDLRNDIPILERILGENFNGILTVYLLGFVLLAISAIIIYLLYSFKKLKNKN